MKKLFVLLCLSLFLCGLLSIFYLVYTGLKFLFSISMVFGLFVTFLVLPVLTRAIFVIFFGIFSSLIAMLFLVSSGNGSNFTDSAQNDGIIDVKARVIK